MAREDSVEISRDNFIVLCLGGYLLSLAYGVTFLIPLMVGTRGGDEAFAGAIISTATVSTVSSIVFSGHLSDVLGLTKSIVMSAFLLALSMLGFFMSRDLGYDLLLYGFLLGVGWGIFYALMPIVVAVVIKPARRIHFMALLSGCMMAGIGTGPIVGWFVSFLLLPIESAFMVAGICSLTGGALCFYLDHRFRKNNNVIHQVRRISLGAVRRIFFSNAIFPIVMVGLGGGIFGSLSSFQTTYAQTFGFDYVLFFVGFMLAAIGSRLGLAGYVVKRDPFLSSFFLASMIVLSLGMFIVLTDDVFLYVLSAVVLGVGYGLTYSVINGLAANEAPEGLMPQSLLLFGLSYCMGVFGFPLVAGWIIVRAGVIAMLYALLVVALLNCLIVVFRLWQQRAKRICKRTRKRTRKRTGLG